MAEKSALQVVLEQVKRLLQDAEDKKLPTGDLPNGIKERLNDLERVVSEFTDLSEKLLRKMGASPDEIAHAMAHPSKHLNESDAATLKLGNELMQKARRKHAQLSFVLKAVKARGATNLRTGKDLILGKSRQKKFRRVGGKDSWMPM